MADQLPSYLTVAAAAGLAAQLPPLAAWAAADDAARAAALAMASSRLDGSRRYQGRRVDPDQPLEFPRFVGPPRGQVIYAGGVWQYDTAVDAPTVPHQVELACLLEADSILAGSRAVRLEAQHDGLASQSVGGMSESYRPPVGPGGVPLLGLEADRLMDRYRLRTGRVL